MQGQDRIDKLLDIFRCPGAYKGRLVRAQALLRCPWLLHHIRRWLKATRIMILQPHTQVQMYSTQPQVLRIYSGAVHPRNNYLCLPSQITPTIVSMETQVPSRYGPGAIICWLCTSAAVILSWSLNRSSQRYDTITGDFLACLLLHVIALKRFATRDVPRDKIGQLDRNPNDGRHIRYLHGLCAFLHRPMLPGLPQWSCPETFFDGHGHVSFFYHGSCWV
jgi:hypothetical protein